MLKSTFTVAAQAWTFMLVVTTITDIMDMRKLVAARS
jgi:hypothetical protein